MSDYKESQASRERKSEIAQDKPRDEEGHFIHLKDPTTASSSEPADNSTLSKVKGFLSDHTHYDKQQDDLLDVHVGNPLKRITELLEDIKKQNSLLRLRARLVLWE